MDHAEMSDNFDNAVMMSDALVAENWCHTRINKVEHCSFMWTIHNYREYHFFSKTPICSSKFKAKTNEKCSWYLIFQPKDGWLFLVLDSVEPWCEKVSVKSKVSVINDKKEMTTVREHMHYSNVLKSKFYYYHPSILFNSDNGLKNGALFTSDKLTIFFELNFIIASDHGFVKNFCGKSVLVENSNLNCTLRMDLLDLFFDEFLSDFVINVDGDEYKVHKNILATRSSVFYAMFEQDMKESKENRVEIKDLDSETVSEMLRYIYTGSVSNLENSASRLLPAADKYDLPHLKNLCQYAIIKKLSVENVADYLILGDMYRASMLKDQAVQYFRIHLFKLANTTAWSKLKEYDYKFFEKMVEVLYCNRNDP